MKTRTLILAAGALASVLVFAGCSGTDSGMAGMDHGSSSTPTDRPSVSADAFNDADVMFASMMIGHHQQAVEMSDVLLAKTGIDERVTELAQKIKDAQEPEIQTMSGWLDDWGQPMSTDDSMSGMDHGSDGTMSAEDMTALENAEGVDASKLFLQQMTEHHQGAIDMAQEEIDNGQNTDAVALANKIVTDQTAEISTMQDLLGTF